MDTLDIDIHFVNGYIRVDSRPTVRVKPKAGPARGGGKVRGARW